MRPERICILIDLKNPDMCRIVFFRHGVQHQNAGLNANSSFDLFPYRYFIVLQLCRVDFDLCYLDVLPCISCAPAGTQRDDASTDAPMTRSCLVFMSSSVYRALDDQAGTVRGTILTVAERARAAIIGFKYGLPRYFAR